MDQDEIAGKNRTDTPMKNVWYFVLCSILFFGGAMGGFLWVLSVHGDRVHQETIQKLREERDAIKSYRMYLEEHGKENAKDYFATTTRSV